MEPSDSASTAMEEPASLEVLVKTLDSQTRTFIVGAQVRQQCFVEMTPLLLVPGFLVSDSFVPYRIGHMVFLLSETGFVLRVFTLMDSVKRGNTKESLPILGSPQPRGTHMALAFGTGHTAQRPQTNIGCLFFFKQIVLRLPL